MMQENNIDAKTNSGVADEELRQTMISMDFTQLRRKASSFRAEL